MTFEFAFDPTSSCHLRSPNYLRTFANSCLSIGLMLLLVVAQAEGQQFASPVAASDYSIAQQRDEPELGEKEKPKTDSSKETEKESAGHSDKSESGSSDKADLCNEAQDDQDSAKNDAAKAEANESSEEELSETKKAAPAGPIVALTKVRILTQSDAGIIDDGIVLIQDGMILDVGAGIEIPESAKQIELAGHTVAPGFIDARSVYGVTNERQAVSDGSSVAIDGFDIYDEDYAALLSEGVTAAYIQPFSGSLAGGVGSVVSVSPSHSIDDRVLNRVAAAQAALKNPSSSIRSHYSEYSRLVGVLEAVKAYKKKWDEYNEYQEKKKKEDEKKAAAKKAAAKGKDKQPKSKDSKKSDGDSSDKDTGKDDSKKETVSSRRREALRRMTAAKRKAAGQEPEKSGKDGESEKDDKEKKPPEKPDVNPVFDRWIDVLSGEIALHIETHAAVDARNALKLTEKFEDISLVFTGLSNVQSVSESITDSRLPIVLGPWLDSERTAIDFEHRVLNWSEQFLDHEGLIVIGSFANSTLGSKTLRHQAAAAVAAGMPRDQAFAAITSNAARLLGVSDKIGSIEKGKRADLVVMTGHPLDSTAAVAHTFVAGEHIYQATKFPSIARSDALPDPAFEMLPAKLPQSYVVRSDRVLSVDGKWSPAAFVVRRGEIKKVMGRDDAADPKLMEFDLGSMAVSPGLITSHTSLGVSSGLSQSSSSDASNLSTADVFSSRLAVAKQLTDGGFTTALFAPPSSNTLAGTASWIRLADEYQVVAAESLESEFPKIALVAEARSSNKYPSSLDGQLRMVNQILDGEIVEDRLYLPTRVAKVIAGQRRAALMDVVEKGKSVLLHASADSEIKSALKLTDSRKLKSVIVFASELMPYLGQISNSGAAIVVRPVRSNDYDWFVADIVAAIEAGVPVAIAGDNPIDIRSTASELVRSGVASSDVRKLLTQPIEHLSASNAVGLTVGSPADFVVWTDDFLSLSALPVSVVSSGRMVDRLPSTQRLLSRLAAEYEDAQHAKPTIDEPAEEMADSTADVQSAITAID